MGLLRSRALRLRLWWTTVLVLVALAGAGLAVAADRPQNPEQRPELTWVADHAAQSWIEALTERLRPFDAATASLSAQGRLVLGRLQALDIDAMRTAVADGDAIVATANVDLIALRDVRDEALARIDESRLGPDTASRVEQINAAVAGAESVPSSWRTLAASAARIAELVDALLRHDGLVFRATTAGRQSSWTDALGFLEQAGSELGAARQIRGQLTGGVDVSTLDDLLARYAAYDAALTALYSYIRDTGSREGREFDALQAAVEGAQAALPSDTSAMSVVVGDAAGPPIVNSLVAIEQARGAIRGAISGVAE